MLIKCLSVGNMEENCYIVTDETTMQCAIIDPGDESNTILDYIESNKIKPVCILLTHGHFDHTGAVNSIMEEIDGLKLFMSKADAVPEGGRRDPFHFAPPEGTVFVNDNDRIAVGNITFKVIATPGHSKGSLCFVSQGVIFSGDTLFHDSCGRTDLDGGDMNELMVSLKILADLPGEYEVWPGHMDPTTLDAERGNNYYMRYALGK